MSRLQELIDELCPDGVVFERFDSVCTLKARIGWQRLTKAERLPVGDYLLITGTDFQSNHKINYSTCEYVTKERYEQDENIQLCDGDVLITKDGTLGKVVIVEDLPKPATLNSHLFVVRSKTARLEQRFIMHYLLSYGFTSAMEANSAGSTIKGFTQKAFSSIKIPVPPIEVQREIVRILDSFQELDDALTAEIKARRKQYAYYRDELFKFERERVEYKKLVAVADVLYGAAFRSALFNTDGDGLPVIRIRDVLRGYSETFYSGEYEQKYVIGDGDMLLGMDGNFNLRLWSGGKALLNQRVCRISSKDDAAVLNGFLRYWLQPVFKSYEGNISRTTVAHMSARVINGIRIPVPPIEVQREIVRILNSFQDHIDTMRSEREARRKQFEHYRDRLLAFLEKAA